MLFGAKVIFFYERIGLEGFDEIPPDSLLFYHVHTAYNILKLTEFEYLK